MLAIAYWDCTASPKSLSMNEQEAVRRPARVVLGKQ